MSGDWDEERERNEESAKVDLPISCGPGSSKRGKDPLTSSQGVAKRSQLEVEESVLSRRVGVKDVDDRSGEEVDRVVLVSAREKLCQ